MILVPTYLILIVLKLAANVELLERVMSNNFSEKPFCLIFHIFIKSADHGLFVFKQKIKMDQSTIQLDTRGRFIKYK